MVRPIIHILLHVLTPALVAKIAYRNRWRYAWLIMLATMLVDLDHLLVEPIYAPNRCSINFHPLHTYWAMAGYTMLVAIPKLRLIGLGLIIHMALDGIDCLWMAFELN